VNDDQDGAARLENEEDSNEDDEEDGPTKMKKKWKM
jgi:hypothetical protein